MACQFQDATLAHLSTCPLENATARLGEAVAFSAANRPIRWLVLYICRHPLVMDGF
jgi:hypothetical protein